MANHAQPDAPTAGTRLRDANDADQPAIAAILRDATRTAYRFMAWPHTDRSFDAFVGDAMTRWDSVRVAEDADGSVIGFLCLEGSLIDQLFVAPRHQKRGVGSKLLDDAKARQSKGLSLHTFQANRSARGFYEKRGFRAVGFGISEAEGEPDVTYVWPGHG
ncbi:MAG: GNAT family N-acetyltransferase [Pseudomonadota bacterium]